jgi:hypothetical protein
MAKKKAAKKPLTPSQRKIKFLKGREKFKREQNKQFERK